jgi:para-aminobenzoate synthetase/4-amino-4-deoxychorismate lyase
MTFTADDLAGLARPFVLLEDRLDPAAPARLFQHPLDVVRCDAADEVAAAFERIEVGLALGLHAAGFLSYELGYALEPKLAPLMPEPRATPLLWMGLFPAPRSLAAPILDAAFAALGPPPPITALAAGHDRAAHVEKAGRVLDLIAAGDIYQANLTFPLGFRYGGDPLGLYGALRCRQPVSHGGVVAFDGSTVLSVSPELFVRVRNGEAVSRPMKGTASRGADAVADAAAKQALAADPKQRAENLMIVDLIRNDLSRICEPGSVRAPHLFAVETYPTFHTLTSTVAGRLRPGVGLAERIAALFPCGSIVGAPKVRAAQVIREFETAPRGVYTGAVGAAAPGGDMEFNVAIRTATLRPDGQGTYGVGGGIVADSDPRAEYDEAMLKGRVLSDLADDYGLIETLRWSATDGYVRADRHLDRLAASAAALGFRFDRGAADRELDRLALAWSGEDRRVRLQLSRGGDLAIAHPPAPAAIDRPLRVGVAAARLDAGDPFLRHKTTRRAAFDRAFAEAQNAGLDEAILLNRSGEVADASRHCVFVGAGARLLTPPLAAGALPGVLRAALLAEGRAVEAPVSLATLQAADRWFLGNSLNGLRLAVFA